jgi:uncharacterized phage-associated protein
MAEYPRDPIRFRFDERKATAAASLLLELAGGSMEYLRLIKLLYYADRESLDLLGRPISGDRYVSMKHGPVLSRVYNLVKAIVFGWRQNADAGPWIEHIGVVDRYNLRLKKPPDTGALSEAEIDILTQVFHRYRDRDKWELCEASHELPEWYDPGESATEIPIEEILQVLGKSEADREDIRLRALEAAHFDRIFGA